MKNGPAFFAKINGSIEKHRMHRAGWHPGNQSRGLGGSQHRERHLPGSGKQPLVEPGIAGVSGAGAFFLQALPRYCTSNLQVLFELRTYFPALLP
jgi:hypothetical protein